MDEGFPWIRQVLLENDGEVEVGGGEVGVELGGLDERGMGVAMTAEMEARGAEGVPCVGVGGIELGGVDEGEFGVGVLPLGLEGHAQPPPCDGRLRVGLRAADERAIGGLCFTRAPLLEMEFAKVEMDVEQVAIEAKGSLVGLLRVGRASAMMVGKAKPVPCLGLRGQELRGPLQPADRVLGLARAQGRVAANQRFLAGRLASGEEQCRRKDGDRKTGKLAHRFRLTAGHGMVKDGHQEAG